LLPRNMKTSDSMATQKASAVSDDGESINSCSFISGEDLTPSDGTNTGNHASDESDSSDAIQNRLAKSETKAIAAQKLIVVLIMMIASITVSYLVYAITRKAERDDFIGNFNSAAEKVKISFEGLVQQMGSISSIGMAATIYSLDRPDFRFPFMALSSFSERTSTAKALSGTLLVSLDPLVTDEDREKYEAYSTKNGKIWM
jgi:hypothetical protein